MISLFGFGLGCTSQKPKKDPIITTEFTEKASLNRLLKGSYSQTRNLRSLHAEGRLNYTSKKESISFIFNLISINEAKPYFRVDIFTLDGTLVYSLNLKKDKTTLFLPKEKRVYRINPYKVAPQEIFPIQIPPIYLSAIFQNVNPLFWIPPAQKIKLKPNHLKKVFQPFINKYYKVKIDKKNGYFMEFFSSKKKNTEYKFFNGTLNLSFSPLRWVICKTVKCSQSPIHIEYSKFEERKKIHFSKEIATNFPNQNVQIHIRYEDFILNKTIKKDLFNLNIRSKVKYMDLDEWRE